MEKNKKIKYIVVIAAVLVNAVYIIIYSVGGAEAVISSKNIPWEMTERTFSHQFSDRMKQNSELVMDFIGFDFDWVKIVVAIDPIDQEDVKSILTGSVYLDTDRRVNDSEIDSIVDTFFSYSKYKNYYFTKETDEIRDFEIALYIERNIHYMEILKSSFSGADYELLSWIKENHRSSLPSPWIILGILDIAILIFLRIKYNLNHR